MASLKDLSTDICQLSGNKLACWGMNFGLKLSSVLRYSKCKYSDKKGRMRLDLPLGFFFQELETDYVFNNAEANDR